MYGCGKFSQIVSPQDFKKDINDHETLHNGVHECSEPLLKECKDLVVENGVHEITDDLEDYDRRWVELNGFVDSRKDKIEEATAAVQKIHDELGPIKEMVTEIVEIISKPFVFGDDTTKGEELLEKLKVIDLGFFMI